MKSWDCMSAILMRRMVFYLAQRPMLLSESQILVRRREKGMM
jgi:hypothetical protein